MNTWRRLLVLALCAGTVWTSLHPAFALDTVPRQSGGPITVDEGTFPDAKFRAWLLDGNNLNGAGADGTLTQEELEKITSLSLAHRGIQSLEGIAHFTELTALTCSGNLLEELDLSQNTKLTVLYASDNSIRQADLPASLMNVDLTINRLSQFDAATFPQLVNLYLGGNELTQLDLGSNGELVFVDVSENGLTQLDLSGNDKLESFQATDNNLSTLVLPSNGKTYSAAGFYQQPARSGYRIEWNSGGHPVGPQEELVASGQTLTAQEVALPYQIELHKNDGSRETVQQSATIGQLETIQQNPFTRTGYQFKGWAYRAQASSADLADQGTLQQDTMPSGGKVVLYALWEPITYTVYFDENQGQGQMQSIQMTYDVGQALPQNTFDRPTYRFLGWAPSPSGGIAYGNGQTVKNLATSQGAQVTLYAVWGENWWNVQFDSVGGTLEGADTQAVREGALASRPQDPQRTGYDFAGWFATPDYSTGEDTFQSAVDRPLVLYAKWEPIRYSLQFDPNTGEGSMAQETLTYDQPQRLPAVQFSRKGHGFLGWSLTPDGPVAFQDQASVKNLTDQGNQSVTLYAQWEPLTYWVTYQVDGQEAASEQVTYGQLAQAPALSRPGYLLQGWYLDEQLQQAFSFSTPIEEGTTLYARWVPVTYQVTFHPNQGTGEMSPLTLTYDGAQALTASGFSRENHRFLGWALEPNGNVVYGDGAVVTNLSQEQGATVSLYAVWGKEVLTLTFPGSNLEPVSVPYGQTPSLPQPQAPQGFAFVGWYLDPDFTLPFDTSLPVTEDQSLYPKFAPLETSPDTEETPGEGNPPPTGSQEDSSGPQTGDPTFLGAALGTLALSGMAGVLLLRRRRAQGKDS